MLNADSDMVSAESGGAEDGSRPAVV